MADQTFLCPYNFKICSQRCFMRKLCEDEPEKVERHMRRIDDDLIRAWVEFVQSLR